MGAVGRAGTIGGMQGEHLTTLADPLETGALGVYRLKRLWSRALLQRRGANPAADAEAHTEHLVLHALGLGLEQAQQYLFHSGPSFEAFERWIVATAGAPAPELVARLNAALSGAPPPPQTRQWLDQVQATPPVLDAADLAFWDEHGYVVLHDAAPPQDLAAAAQATCDFIGARLDDPATWYAPNTHGIMVQLFQHDALRRIRASPRIHKAFAQLWGHADLWATTDRVGFNPPQTARYRFRGPDLHWDVSLAQPVPFGTQGILYLTDTEAEQGAFTLVPGFHRSGGAWLASLPRGANPREQNLHALGSTPIAGRAGDFIIWHQALPHGSRPNTSTRPRLVHYLNMHPAVVEVREPWI